MAMIGSDTYHNTPHRISFLLSLHSFVPMSRDRDRNQIVNVLT
jgi:predicted N-formylglutamate amidohydrolase